MLTPRPYQQEAIDAVWHYYKTGGTGNPLTVVPTAGGKSLVMASLMKGICTRFPEQRILVVTHVSELVKQNYLELMEIWPEADAGIYSAGLNRRDTQHQIIFASIQSIHKKAFEFEAFNIAITDEAHLINNKKMGSYRKFFDDCLLMNPHFKIWGYTATPARLGSGLLIDGKDALFDEIVCNIDIKRLIDAGYLAPLTTVKTETQADLSNVKTIAGEFNGKQMEDVLDRDDLTEAAISETLRLASNRKAWMVFCAGVKHSEHVKKELERQSIHAEIITGKTPKVQREKITEDFKKGRIRVLVSCGTLTTGFNARLVDCIVLLRGTKSKSLYIQILGRGMRTSPETQKTDCLVIDFTGTVDAMGPIDQMRFNRLKPKHSGNKPFKYCPKCEAETFISARECPECGYVFEFAEKPKHGIKASTAPILSQYIKAEWFDVKNIVYTLHQKQGKPPSMRVDYFGSLKKIASEWVCFEHTGFAYEKARRWWTLRSGQPVPKSVKQALEMKNTLRKAERIQVNASSKYPEIKNYELETINTQQDASNDADFGELDTANEVTSLHSTRNL